MRKAHEGGHPVLQGLPAFPDVGSGSTTWICPCAGPVGGGFLSIDRSTFKIRHRVVAAGTALTAALVITLAPFTVAKASEVEPAGALVAETGVRASASFEQTQEQIEGAADAKAAADERHAEAERRAAEAAAKAKAEAEARAAEEAASYTYVEASMYGEGDGFMGGTTASGETLTSTSMAVAMRTMPLGTKIQLTYNGKTVTAVVNDRGPYVGNRQIDLQPAVAHALGFGGTGTVGYKVVE